LVAGRENDKVCGEKGQKRGADSLISTCEYGQEESWGGLKLLKIGIF